MFPTRFSEGDSPLLTCSVTIDDILELRRKAFHALPPEILSFDSDRNESTIHIATYLRNGKEKIGDPVCCASFMFEPLLAQKAWQLRAMATDPKMQRTGFGEDLLNWGMEMVLKHSGVGVFWCNAWAPAIGFYEKLGWHTISHQFEIPRVGPHRKMMKTLSVP